MSEPLQVISMGTGDSASLAAAARKAMACADVIIGDDRFQPTVAALAPTARWQPYPKPFGKLPDLIAQFDGRRIVILASGDALFHGVGSLLRRHVGAQRLVFHPHISSLQAAMHALGLPWQDLQVLSLHGRPLSRLRAHLAPGERLGLFTDERAHPAAIAAEVAAAGYTGATLTVCENLGSPDQQIREFAVTALAVSEQRFHALNVCILELPLVNSERDGRPLEAQCPGIADERFSTGSEPGFGMISKREVRLSILSLMQPCRGETAWDIGAGCGSVSVEWARANPGGCIHAIERDSGRLRHLDINRERFGVTLNCLPVHTTAPDGCQDLPAPHCIFIGGSVGRLPALLDFAWSRLGNGGKLVASAVTRDSQQALEQFMHRRHQERHSTDWCELAVRKSLPGSVEVRRLQPVQLLRCVRREPM